MNNRSNRGFTAVVNTDGTVNISTINNDGTKCNKLISLNVFSQLVRSGDETVELPLLPNGIRKFMQKGDNVVIVTEHQGTVIENFSYYDDNYRVPTPQNSIWMTLLRVNNNSIDSFKVIKTWVFSMTMPLLTETQELYKWPFPNYSTTYSPGICWGNDENFRRLKNNCKIRNLASFHDMYFSANFNDDLGFDMEVPSDFMSTSEGRRRGNTKLDYLGTQEHFSNECLIREDSRYNTFDKAINVLIGR